MHAPPLLRYQGCSGVLHYEGLTVPLDECPQVFPGLRLLEVNFLPTVRVCELRESARTWRPMTREEVSLAWRWINETVQAIRLVVV